MKQRITLEDLLQLTPEQQQKLKELWKPEDGDWFYGCHSDNFERRIKPNGCESCENKKMFNEETRQWLDSHFDEVYKEWMLSPYPVDSGAYGASLKESPPCRYSLPLLSIGQMIELLSDKGKFTEVEADCIVNECVYNKDDRWIWIDWEGRKKGTELCDDLWQAVKEVLAGM